MPTNRPCPFCVIQSTAPPSSNPAVSAGPSASAYVLLSTASVIAFLDIAPLSRGHVILCARAHHAKLSDMSPTDSAVLGFWLQVVSRGVMSGLMGDRWEGEDESWDVVQANGAQAGQTIPHAHYHVIPRPRREVTALYERARDPGIVLDQERRRSSVVEAKGTMLSDEDALETCSLIQVALRRDVRRLKAAGTIVEGEGDWDLWMAVDGKKGLRL